MRVNVIIPALNEEEALPLVLRAIPAQRVDSIIVVDNGSTDKTPEVAEAHGARVVTEKERGYGAACLRGLEALDEETEIVVFLDGDFSDHPEELPILLKPIESGEADFVIGSRMLGSTSRRALLPQAYWGNRLAVFLIRAFWGFSYTDLGPFRAIRTEGLGKLRMEDRNFGWTVEMQIRAVEEGLRITERPVSYRNRIGKSKITGTVRGTLQAGFKILYTIFRFAMRKRKR